MEFLEADLNPIQLQGRRRQPIGQIRRLMKSLPVGPLTAFSTGLRKVNAESAGDKDKTGPFTVQNRLRFWCIGELHNTSISSVSTLVNTCHRGV